MLWIHCVIRGGALTKFTQYSQTLAVHVTHIAIMFCACDGLCGNRHFVRASCRCNFCTNHAFASESLQFYFYFFFSSPLSSLLCLSFPLYLSLFPSFFFVFLFSLTLEEHILDACIWNVMSQNCMNLRTQSPHTHTRAHTRNLTRIPSASMAASKMSRQSTKKSRKKIFCMFAGSRLLLIISFYFFFQIISSLHDYMPQTNKMN